MKTIFAAALFTAGSSWAGLCADIGSSTTFKAQDIQEYIWDGVNIHSLETATESNTLSTAENIQVIKSSLAYEIPSEITLGCQWVSSSTKILKNLDTQTLIEGTKDEFYKIRDAQEVDVNNDGGVTLEPDLYYWLHQVTTEADTTIDGYKPTGENTVSLQGKYFPQSEEGSFDMWYATIFIQNEDGTRTAKLDGSYLIHRDSNTALEKIQEKVTEENYPSSTYSSDLQLIRLRFSELEDGNVSLAQQEFIRNQFQIQDNTVIWNSTQNQVEIFKMDGSLIQNESNVNMTHFENLPKGQYIIRSGEVQFRISKF